MSLSLVIALAVGSMIVSLAVMVGSIWLAARVWQVPDVSWRQAALAILWLTLSSWLLLAGACFVILKLIEPESTVSLALTGLILLLAQLVLIVVCVGRPLRTGKVKAVCVTLTAYAAQSVVGLALAMSCRDRFLEAFVVPTGAMAPTIYGAHFDLTCPNCGHAFAGNASHRADQYGRQAKEFATCLNCNTEIPVSPNASVASGDRILVDKKTAPHRWDCVTFREPSPQRLTYIKRLVGLPGERVEFAAGDVFIDGQRIRKHPHEQTDLWMPRHDTQAVPRDHDDDTPRWHPAAADSLWAESNEGGWAFNGLTADADALEFRGEITDACQYDVQLETRNDPKHVAVGDIRVTCNVSAFSGTGSLRFVWQFAGQNLRFSVGSHKAEIANDDGALATNESLKFIRPGEPLQFAVRDGTACLLCGHDELMANFLPESLESANDESQSPSNPCRIRLVAEQCHVEIARVRIDRDIYYVSRVEMERRIGFPSSGGSETSSELGADQYFMLGDNVLASKDSRFIGPIQSSDLIGVARWRYWPKTRWHTLD